MKIITKEIEDAFKKQGDTSEMETADIKIVMKLFNPSGVGTWYIYDKEDNDVFWCYANLNDPEMAECGTVSMDELLSYRGPYGLGIERDINFKPLSKSLAEVIKIVESGGHV